MRSEAQLRTDEAKRERARMKVLEKIAPTLLPMMPAGDWVGGWEDEGEGRKGYVVESAALEIKFTFWPWGEGTTSFKVKDGWRTFDRRGVESSFYWQDFKRKPIDVGPIIAEQLERIAKSREFHSSALKVPMVGYSIAPAALATYKQALGSRGSITFTPSGFGTGYNVVTRKPKHNYGVRRATAELETFFDRSPLWVVDFDCD